MTGAINSPIKIPISDILLDEKIYPRQRIDQKRVGIFAENIRDGSQFDPIEVEPYPDKLGKYRILDGAHRWSAYKATGAADVKCIIKNLDGTDPLLYAAAKAIGPRQLTEEEARTTARRAFQHNPGLTSAEIGKAIGRARRTVDAYIADLKAVILMDLDLKIFRMNALGIPQERIATRLEQTRDIVRSHLGNMATLPKSPKDDLSRGYTVSQVAEKHGWTEAMVRNFQHTPAVNEIPEDAILVDDYLKILHKTGWRRTHIIQAPLSSERFDAGVVSAMQKKKILGVTSRYVIISK